MLTKGITKKIDHPHEPGQWVVIRKASSGYIDLAREAFTRRASRSIKDMGGLGGMPNFKRCPKCGAQQEDGHECNPLDLFAKEEREKNPSAVDATTLDRKIMLNAAIASWSEDEQVNEESVAYLDEFTADWLFREIVSYVNEDMTAEAKKDETKTSSSS
ncbi:MAG: hypothetical protein IIC88_07135 [Chloroflexi bacterium]|nr:hypothetical protein [Chloroflexota bacterium]